MHGTQQAVAWRRRSISGQASVHALGTKSGTATIHTPKPTANRVERRSAPRPVRPAEALVKTVQIERPVYQAAKRCLDITVCLLLLPVAIPLLVGCAIAIWLENPGPVIFRQWRTGKGGRRFPMYKLRTMVTNAEELKRKYAHLNELTWPDFKITNDPRITRVGRILRKTSLDELPQIWSVLVGDMSLVGPRPTSFAADTYSLWHTERLEVVPGITGLWQISGRSNVDFDERVRLDVAYIENRSFWYDLKILMRTAGAIMGQRGAC
jgi:lipopolysaccharide/colanic/teichoic acid biosynthesis glycosyltransferase